MSNQTSTSFAIQWTKLHTDDNRCANFYIMEVKSTQGIILALEIVPGNVTATVIKRLRPSTKYRVGVYGVDGIGQPYKSLESFASTNKSTKKECFDGFISNESMFELKFVSTYIGVEFRLERTKSTVIRMCSAFLNKRAKQTWSQMTGNAFTWLQSAHFVKKFEISAYIKRHNYLMIFYSVL